MANKKIQATATLFLDTKDAQSDAKKFVNDIKQKLSEVETAADKVTVFKDMVAYIAQVDRALSALRKNNKDAFNSMFDGLDINLKQQLEGLFGVNGAQLGQVDALREKLNTLTLKSSIKEIRTFAKEINTLFTSIGVSAPFDNIDEQFSGRTNTGHIQALATSLANFATVWEDLSARVSQGFGGTGGFGSGAFGELSKEIQEQIDKLKKQKEELQEVLNAINNPKKTKVSLSEDADEQLEQLKQFKQEFNNAKNAKEAFEKSGLTKNELLANPEYLKSIAGYIKSAQKLQSAFTNSELTGRSLKWINRDGDGAEVNNESAAVVDKFVNQHKEAVGKVKSYYADLVKDIDAQIKQLMSGSGAGGAGDPTKGTVSLYDKLKKSVEEYLEIRKQLNQIDKEKQPEENKRLTNRKSELIDEIQSLKNISEDDQDLLFDVFDEADSDGAKLNEIVEKFCNVLKIKIPNAAESASSATGSAFAKITQDATEASEAVQNVMYHLGNLLNGQGKSRDTFGDMAENLTSAAAGTRWEQYGFGALGGGLFGVSDPSTITQNPGASTFIQSIDLSKYNMYMADTEERATALIDFLSKLQKFSMKSAEPNYSGFDAQLQGVDINSLYDQAKLIFDQSELTKDQFEVFINEMVAMLKQAGLAFDTKTGELNFTNLTKEIANSENISTRFMKMLGYHGVNVGGTSFDGLGQGSVLFDFDKVDIVGYFNTVQEAVEDYQKIINQIDGGNWVGSTEQLQQYAHNIGSIINKLTEAKNIGKLSGESGVDETLNKLTQIRKNIDGILTGKDLNGDNPFVTITTGSVETGKAVESANQKLREQEQLYQNLRSAIKGTLSDVVDVDDVTYAFDTLEKEIEAGLLTTLDQCIERFKLLTGLDDKRLTSIKDDQRVADSWDYYQGNRYVSDNETVIDSSEYNQLREDLADERDRANQYAGDAAVAEDRADKAEARAAEAEARVDELREQLSTQTNADHKSQLAQAEVAQLELLQQKLLEVKTAVDAKTQAFEEEYVTVDAAVDAEIASLNKLKDVLTEIQEILQVVLSVSKINIGDVELTQGKENVNVVSSAIQTIEQTLGQILAVLQGFTGLEAEGKNSIKHKESTANIPANNANATEHLVSKLNDLATEGTLAQIPAAIKNLADAILSKKSAEIKQTVGNTENPHYVTDPQGNLVYAYRGIHNSYSGLVSNRYHGGTFSTDNIELAKEYAGELGKVEKVLLSMKNPMEIDGHGALWNQIEYIGDNSDKASQRLYELRSEISATKQLLAEAEKIQVTDKEIKNIRRGLMTESDTKREREISYWTKELEKLEVEKASILSDKSNPYGKKNTNELVEIAKNKGYDGVIFKNIIDSATGDVKDLSTVMVTFEQDQIHYLETISSTFDSAVDSLKNHYGDLIQHVSASSDEVEASIRKMVELRGKVDTGEISQDEYDKFVAGNAIARDFDALADQTMNTPNWIDGALNGEEFYLNSLINDINMFINGMRDRLQKVAQTFGKESIPFGDLLNYQDVVNTDTEVETSNEVGSEVQQLNNLQAALVQVKNAIMAKTKAFIDEGTTVGQVVGKEIAALKNLSEIVDGIAPKVNTLAQNLKNIDTSKLGVISQETSINTDTGVQDAPATDSFKTKLSAQKGTFTKYRKDVQDADYLTEDLKKQIDSLAVSLGEVSDQPGLDAWIKRFVNLKENVQAAKSEFEQMNLGMVNLYQSELKKSYGKLTFPQRKDLSSEYLQAIVLLNKQTQAVKEGSAVEIAEIEKITAALQEKINKQIEANKAVKDATNAQKKNGNFGSTASINATAKYNSLIEKASNKQFANSSTIAAALMDYEEAYRRMIKTRDELRSKNFVDDSDKEEFKRLTTECNKASSALEKLIQNTMKLKGEAVNENPYMLGSDFKDDKDGRISELTNFVQGIKGADLATLQFKDNWNEAVFAVNNGDGTFTKMTATFTEARNEIVALAGDTKKVQGKFESFIDGVKNRLQSLSQYFIATVGIYDVWNVIKQGINYVREIDSALTELKKVTDATETSYNNFLQTASKTAATLGSTVSDFVDATADFARLGYDLNQASQLAEAASVYKNVGDGIDDVAMASESIISTMKAFGIEANNAMGIVDRFNEVGKFIAQII